MFIEVNNQVGLHLSKVIVNTDHIITITEGTRGARITLISDQILSVEETHSMLRSLLQTAKIEKHENQNRKRTQNNEGPMAIGVNPTCRLRQSGRCLSK